MRTELCLILLYGTCTSIIQDNFMIDCMARVTDGFKVRVGLHQGCIRKNGSCV